MRTDIIEKWKAAVAPLRYMDDLMFTIAFDGNTESVQELLRVIMSKPKLKVISATTQRYISNLGVHDVKLDVIAEDEDDIWYNIEIQRDPDGADPRRPRYYTGSFDRIMLDKGHKYSELPELYIIFITETDYWGHGLPIYSVDKVIEGIDVPYDDGVHVMYVNGAYRGSDAVGLLMEDLQCADPDKMHNPVLANRMRFLKETEDGIVKIEDTFLELAKLTNQARDEELQEARDTIANQASKLVDKDDTIAARDSEIAARDSEIAARDSEIARLEGLLMAHGIMP